MSTIAIIPARGGSKGIKNKNIRILNSKPLIAWSIEQALNSSEISEVYVSTDSEKIASIASNYGAKIPFLRPSEIADDFSTSEAVMLHFSNWLIENKKSCDNLILIQATSPVRASYRFDDAIKKFKKSQKDSLVTVCASHRFFWRTDNSTANYDFMNRPRRQDILPNDRLFLETGSFYVSKFEKFLKYQCRLFEDIYLYETPHIESFEIDDEIDLKICEALLKYGINYEDNN